MYFWIKKPIITINGMTIAKLSRGSNPNDIKKTKERYAANIEKSPCAIFIIFNMPTIIAKPHPIKAYNPPSNNPRTNKENKKSMLTT
jgi:hypothetical protein